MRPNIYIIEVKAKEPRRPDLPPEEPMVGRFMITREFVDVVDERVLIDILGKKVVELVKL